MAAIAATALALYATIVVPWDWVPGGELVPMPVGELFTTEQVSRAEQFASYRRVLNWSAYGVSLGIALVLGLTPMGPRLIRRITGRLAWWVAVPVAALGLLLVGRLVVLPFSLLLREQSLEYGLTRQLATGWLVDQVLSLLVGWVITALVLTMFVGLARRFPRRWFVAAGGLAATFTVAGSVLYPVVVEPLFNDFDSLPPGPLRASVLELADREGVQVEDVLIADASKRTTTLNAYVSGLWGTKRVVVYDTLVQRTNPEQAGVVIAHELAHAKHRDVLIGTTMGALGALLAAPLAALILSQKRLRQRTGTCGPGDPAAVALLLALFAVGSLVTSPIANSVSRAIEMRADRTALTTTGADKVFIQIQKQLALTAIQDPTPPEWSQFWSGSHPTVLQRAGLPESLKAVR